MQQFSKVQILCFVENFLFSAEMQWSVELLYCRPTYLMPCNWRKSHFFVLSYGQNPI